MDKLDTLFPDNGTDRMASDDAELQAFSLDLSGKVPSRTASAVDLEWLSDGKTIDVEKEKMRNPNNCKSELEIQWSHNGIKPSYKNEDVSGEVERNPGEDNTAKAKKDKVIKFARHLMNSGFMGKRLASAIKSKFTAEAILAARSELTEQLSYDGIVGTVLVDARGYRACSEAIKVASNSPYKKYIRGVIGCNCGSPICVATGKASVSTMGVNRNASDAFLASDTKVVERTANHCPSTKAKIFTAGEELSDENMKDTLIDVSTMAQRAGASLGDIKSAAAKSGTARVASLFRLLDSAAVKKAAAKYASTVDNAEHRIAAGELAFDLEPSVGGIDIDGSKGMSEEFADQELPVDIAILINVVPVNGNEIADIDTGDVGFSGTLPIDEQGFVPPEMEGGDEFELGGTPGVKDPMDVDMKFDEIV
jgi:hypothetical protein